MPQRNVACGVTTDTHLTLFRPIRLVYGIPTGRRRYQALEPATATSTEMAKPPLPFSAIAPFCFEATLKCKQNIVLYLFSEISLNENYYLSVY